MSDLPDELLVRCLGFLDFKQRQRAARVSQRFAAAACSPQLLREVDVGTVKNVPALSSLRAWLVRHGQRVRRLLLDARTDSSADPDAFEGALTSCLAAAAAASAAQLMQLAAGSMVTGTAWLAGLPSLQRLELIGSVWSLPLHLSPAISALTALASLRLEGDLSIKSSLRLPTSITRLSLSHHYSPDMPAQFAQLPRLAELQFEECSYAADSLDQVSRLAGSLSRLESARTEVPAALCHLTRLRHLDLWEFGLEDEGSLGEALAHLTLLTCLVLLGDIDRPAALPVLPQMQRCFLRLPTYPLLPGPWLASLRWLSCGTATLLYSVASLQAAAALEFLEVVAYNDADWGCPQAAELFEWKAQHPPLRRVVIDPLPGDLAPGTHLLQLSITCLRSRRPGLGVHCCGIDSGQVERFLDLYCKDNLN